MYQIGPVIIPLVYLAHTTHQMTVGSRVEDVGLQLVDSGHLNMRNLRPNEDCPPPISIVNQNMSSHSKQGHSSRVYLPDLATCSRSCRTSLTFGRSIALLRQHCSAMFHTSAVIPGALNRRGFCGRSPRKTMSMTLLSEEPKKGVCPVASWGEGPSGLGGQCVQKTHTSTMIIDNEYISDLPVGFWSSVLNSSGAL